MVGEHCVPLGWFSMAVREGWKKEKNYLHTKPFGEQGEQGGIELESEYDRQVAALGKDGSSWQMMLVVGSVSCASV